jgi:hypothetical protein
MLKLKVNRPLVFSIQLFEKGAVLVLALFSTDRFGTWVRELGVRAAAKLGAQADATTNSACVKSLISSHNRF